MGGVKGLALGDAGHGATGMVMDRHNRTSRFRKGVTSFNRSAVGGMGGD